MPKVRKESRTDTKASGVLARIAPVSAVDTGLKINVYGRSGTGKTTFACTFPKPLLLIGTEDGTKSVSNVKGVDFVMLEESGEIGELVDFCSKSKYKTVVLDTATGLQDLILKEILGLEELPVQKSWGMATRDQWSQCALQTKERLRQLLGLDCHVVILAQEREFNVETDASDLLMPYVASALTPSVTGWLNPACDYICQTFIRPKVGVKRVKIGGKVIEKEVKERGAEFCLRVGPDAVYTTKFRAPKGWDIPDAIVDPSYDKLVKLIKGG